MNPYIPYIASGLMFLVGIAGIWSIKSLFKEGHSVRLKAIIFVIFMFVFAIGTLLQERGIIDMDMFRAFTTR